MCQSEYNLIPRFDFFSLNVHILTSYFVNFIINSVSWPSALQEHTPGPASQACTHVVPLNRHPIGSWRSLVLFSECYVALICPARNLGLELNVLLLVLRVPHLGNYKIYSW